MEEKNLLNSTDSDLDSLAEDTVSNMEESEILKLGKNQKIACLFAFVVLLLWSALFAGLAIYGLATNKISFLMFFLVPAVSIPYAFWLVRPSYFKWNYKQWAKYKIKMQYRSKKYNLRALEINSSLNGKKIKSTKIIDSHMEYSDKLHGFLNYQEVIQHHVCKFLVTFTDNSTKVYDAEEGSSLYRKLIMFVNNPAETQQNNAISSADELAKYKKLLDEGAITQEEYDKKKKELL